MGLTTIAVKGAEATANQSATAAALVVTQSPARLYSITIFNGGGAAVYYQVFDATVEPANGTAPKMVVKVPNDSQGSFDFGDGRIFKNGIVIAGSSTAITLTDVTLVNSIVDCTYRNT